MKAMTRQLGTLLLLFSAGLAMAEGIPATTEGGAQVLLHDDGSWEYLVNRPGHLASVSGIFELDYDTSRWRLDQQRDNEDTEYELSLRSGDGYAMFIAERAQIPLESLKRIAFENFQANTQDARIVEDETVILNGTEVARMDMVGTIEGVELHYHGLY